MVGIGTGPVHVLGRAGMDFYAEPAGTAVAQAEGFFACLGGSAGNIAAGLARQGRAAALISAVSDDAVGRFVLAELRRYGVGSAHVAVKGGATRTSLAVTETRGAPETVIYRNGAADLMLEAEDLAGIDWAASGGLIVTGTALAAEPSRGAALAAMQAARDTGRAVVLDVDYRPYSWRSEVEAAEVCRSAAALCSLVVGNDEEWAVMAGGEGLSLARATGRDRVAIYKKGAEGCETFLPGRDFRTGIFAVTALKPMGAGDGFMAGLIAGLAEGGTMEEAVERGAAAAALVVSSKGCAPAMPTAAELEAFLAERRR
ncbi:PfkB family carbohydrate kinase [Histidinibacterium lentulum]|uniref:Permease n=1 Tax=Histidinibacterium lentulum TaxID=2480588 RepID=A0A3N2R8E3_9RHOB|nr:PfkB family carbohydrate kinase [Histidinibacterium lentulum]ROU03705.1 permease [Histidinibacterium lentulum]